MVSFYPAQTNKMATITEDNEYVRDKNFDYVKKELELLHKCCIEHKKTVFCIRQAAEPFYKDLNKHENSKRSRLEAKLLLKWSAIICLVALVISQEPVRKYVISTARQTSMSVLALWDWRRFHDMPCFLQNPLKKDEEENKLEDKDCQICANITTVPKLKGSSMEELADKYLKKELPVIVISDAEGLSRFNRKTDIDTIYKLYLDDNVMNMYSCCHFESNISIKKKDHRTFLRNLRDGQYTQYYANWQNCFVDAAKLFRQLYRRPEYLPSTIELAETSWLFMSSNYTDTTALELPFEDGIVMLFQLTGYIDLVLKPKSECQSDCKPVTVQLLQGSVFITTDLLYDLEYRPTKGKLAITVGIGGSFDY